MADATPNLLEQLPQTPGAAGSGPAFEIAFYVMVSMVVLVGIAYLVSKALSNRRLEDWAKNEFLQVLVSAAIIGSLFFLMDPGSGIITQAFNSLKPSDMSFGCMAILPSESVLCFAYGYLQGLVDIIMFMMGTIFVVNIVLEILAKLSIDIIIVEVTPLAGLSAISAVLGTMLQSLFFLGVLTQAEQMLLVFINATALTIFLPIGAVLRTFFATRRLGGALIALAVGMYIVFPLTIALNAVAVGNMQEQALQNFTATTQAIIDSDPTSNFGDNDIASADAWGSAIDGYVALANNMKALVESLPSITTTIISSLVVQVVFLPILSVILTVIAIKELAALFGAEINLAKFEV